MDNQSYYRLLDNTGCDKAENDRYLVVNCTGVFNIDRPFVTNRPSGRQDYYLMYLDQGQLDVLLDGRRQTLQPGHAVLFHPGDATWYAKNDAGTMTYYWIHFTGYGVPAVLRGCGLEAAGSYYAGPRQEMTEIFHELFQNYLSRDSCFELAAAAQLANILVLIRRSLDELARSRHNQVTGQIKASLEYIHHHYSQPISLAQLAAMEHRSPSRYGALFRQIMGVSPYEFIVGLRLRMAADLMMKTNLSLKQIAQMVGYEDQLYFSRLFRSRRGLSPRQYVRSLAAVAGQEAGAGTISGGIARAEG